MNTLNIKTKQRTIQAVLTSIIRVILLFSMTSLFSYNVGFSAEAAVVIPAPVSDEQVNATDHSETMVIAGGCFWGVQGVFQHVKGVKNAVSGYAGGGRETASYDKVSRGDTGHAESVQITYDPTQITYGKLLQIFFSVAHNPTELNHQGPDSGTQYRSAIFAMNNTQRDIAQAYLLQLNKARVFNAPTATRIESFSGFYAAEAHHQNFLTLNPNYPYIVFNDLPKIGELKRLFPNLYQVKPVLVALASH